MINSIAANLFRAYQNSGTVGNKTNAQTAAGKNSVKNFDAGATLELSSAGRNALAQLQNQSVDDEIAGGAYAADETKLSAKAQSYLENLRKKYGDYDISVSSNPDAASTVGSSKEYSVIFTPEEIEQMANDDEYAEKVMGNVGNAVDMLKNLSEKDLGEGVQFSQLAVSFDNDGNMKLFAQLEKLSADQKERLDAARERRAEEKSDEEKVDEEPTQILYKSADIEADDEESLLAKILGIDWNAIAEQEAFIW